MRFINWIKSLFKKSDTPRPSTTPTAQENQAAQNAKGWQQAWTNYLVDIFMENIAVLSTAVDRFRLHPKYDSLDNRKKATLWAELFKAMAYYESGYNPNSQSVDVGTKDNRDTWSVGLMQMSVVDQVNHRLDTHYNFAELCQPIPNLHLAVLIMVQQIQKRKTIFIKQGDPGIYWAVIRPGGKYDKTEKILSVVNALPLGSPADSPVTTEDVNTPWMTIAEKEKGVSEISGSKDNQRIVDYHQVTTLKAKDDETAWCASFVCWVLKTAGYAHTASAWARDFLKYGTKLESPKYGCIVVFTRGSNSGHVAFYIKTEGNYIYCLGGNQSNQVNVSKYDKSRVLGYRWPIK